MIRANRIKEDLIEKGVFTYEGKTGIKLIDKLVSITRISEMMIKTEQKEMVELVIERTLYELAQGLVNEGYISSDYYIIFDEEINVLNLHGEIIKGDLEPGDLQPFPGAIIEIKEMAYVSEIYIDPSFIDIEQSKLPGGY